jgi:hypothetical protein
MASPAEGSDEPSPSSVRPHTFGSGETSTASSSSSAGGSEEQGGQARCPYKTASYWHGECSRYFDCPSHQLQRAVSHVGGDDRVDGGEDRQDQPGTSEGGRRAGESEAGAQVTSQARSRAERPLPETPQTPQTPARTDPSATTASSPRTAPFQGFLSPHHHDNASSDIPRPAPPGTPTLSRPSVRPARMPSEIILPRWQPDAEVTLCPICGSQFSIWVRKHHCRKCGRVVCGACSPHRILIPFQYVVHPPGTPQAEAQRRRNVAVSAGDDSGFAEFNRLVGGERVRLCNPCVPDPNIAPPQTPEQSQASRGPFPRATSAAEGVQPPTTLQPRPYISSRPGGDFLSRSRSATHSSTGSSSRNLPTLPFPTNQARIFYGTPPAYYPFGSAATPTTRVGDASRTHRRSEIPQIPPRAPVAEEDECPVCHRILPARTLPDWEAQREAHIAQCVTAYSTSASSREAPGTDSGSGPVLRLTRMFPYTATEKDCVDSAECTICLENYEVGQRMARLECLCRFHYDCIGAWFAGHPGRCPVHQHDGLGY